MQVVVLPDMPQSADLALRADLLAVLRGQQARVAAAAAAPRVAAGRARNGALAPVDAAADCVCLITDDKEFGGELRQAQVRPRSDAGAAIKWDVRCLVELPCTELSPATALRAPRACLARCGAECCAKF